MGSIDNQQGIIIGLIACVAIAFVAIIIYVIINKILKSPFHFPFFVYNFDVSGKREPKVEDLLDEFFIQGHFTDIEEHKNYIENIWKKECLEKINKSRRLKKRRENQFQICCSNESRAFKFTIVRQQTRYKQVNYVRTPYKVYQTIGTFECDYDYLKGRNDALREINYECTLRQYHSKNQRKLLTKELKEEIKLRDNYTCQICGKYMPDEVGLHIDHIVPVSKGGKSVPSNLQVLCSKCNGKKSNN